MLPTISHLTVEQTKCPLVVLSTSSPVRLEAVVAQLLMTRFPVSLSVITKSQNIRTMCLHPEKKITFNLFVLDLLSECDCYSDITHHFIICSIQTCLFVSQISNLLKEHFLKKVLTGKQLE